MVRRMWAGFVNGKMHVEDTTGDYGTYKRPGIFLTKKRARLEYQDVRPIEVRELKVRRASTRTEDR